MTTLTKLTLLAATLAAGMLFAAGDGAYARVGGVAIGDKATSNPGPSPIIRDHRSAIIRDHRSPIVRDHRERSLHFGCKGYGGPCIPEKFIHDHRH